MNKPANCDIFCNVIDNYGDIGVCWRLARQLANEHGLAVRLWVDDPASLAKLCPEADAGLERQQCRGVEVRHWTKKYFNSFPHGQTLSRPVGHPLPPAGEGLGEREIADLVIEAFACKLPQSYIEAMAALEHKPVWINLEYLSAEDWVESHHKLPSPHPSLPLTKYFFFPGFTPKTGGLLLERDLLARRDTFSNDVPMQQAFWRSVGMEMPASDTLKVSLFAYENGALHGLFDAWSDGPQSVLCLVPEGRILAQVGQYFGDDAPHAGSAYARGSLQVRVLPFVEQDRFDLLLWACDVNFVRGEDSFVRAQWAGKPLIWQIYPQHDEVHLKKLEAFLMLYGRQLGQPENAALQGMWMGWNPSTASGQALAMGAGHWWPAFIAVRGELERHAQHWAQQLTENSLSLNLLDFYVEIGRMRALEIEGQ
jgi:uncharacterized repeat protein (TIGR03837 family)